MLFDLLANVGDGAQKFQMTRVGLCWSHFKRLSETLCKITVVCKIT